jgi:hypothetical protein
MLNKHNGFLLTMASDLWEIYERWPSRRVDARA